MGSAGAENKGGKRVVSDDDPILVGLGANLSSPRYGPPVATLEAALKALAARGLRILSRSRWWESAPVPLSDQPWYVNGVVDVATSLGPVPLLALLHEVEAAFGRVRSLPNAPRVLDLDLLAYGAEVREGPTPPLLPHPRLAVRAFVLYPLADIRPGWRHPITGLGLPEMIAALPADQIVRPLP
jgi:2-amino-4-hydroxy-6-hydroxymethyldihydropteridine diphosphokinase